MSRIRVTKAIAEVFSHPNADSLEIVKFGNIQLVSQKGIYKNGDFGVVVMNKTIVPDRLLEDYPYLSKTAQGYRVKEVVLRGEVSEGISLSQEALEKYYPSEIVEAVQEADFGSDLSDLLEMKEYEVPVPIELAGQVQKIPPYLNFSQHDLLQFGSFRESFDDNEEVILTEKLHGSQIIILFYNGEVYVSSKGLLSKGLCIKESDSNTYWKGYHKSNAKDFYNLITIKGAYKDQTIALYGELVNIQSGFTYGAKQGEYPIYFFDVRIDKKPIVHNMDQMSIFLKTVPILCSGKFSDVDPYAIANDGKSKIDNQTIREGIVIKPVIERFIDRDNLQCKVISTEYDKKVKKKGLDDGN